MFTRLHVTSSTFNRHFRRELKRFFTADFTDLSNRLKMYPLAGSLYQLTHLLLYGILVYECMNESRRLSTFRNGDTFSKETRVVVFELITVSRWFRFY